VSLICRVRQEGWHRGATERRTSQGRREFGVIGENRMWRSAGRKQFQSAPETISLGMHALNMYGNACILCILHACMQYLCLCSVQCVVCSMQCAVYACMHAAASAVLSLLAFPVAHAPPLKATLRQQINITQGPRTAYQ
jgi:hypothetical protein